MEGSKIKNIIILILLLLNIVLLFVVVGRETTARRGQQAARENAIAIIQGSGVTLQDETVPHEMGLQPMQVTRDLEQERVLAAQLVGEDMTVEVRGGDVYRYSGTAGWIQFHSGGEFSAEFSDGALLTMGRSEADHAASVLEQIGFSGQLMNNTLQNGAGEISFRQMLGGIPVLGCQATLIYEEGQLKRIADGCRLNGTPAGAEVKASISVATALMRMFNGMRELGDIYNQIESITPAYSLSANISGPTGLIPVWYIRTDTGAYQLDTATGVLSRVVERSGVLLMEGEPAA